VGGGARVGASLDIMLPHGSDSPIGPSAEPLLVGEGGLSLTSAQWHFLCDAWGAVVWNVESLSEEDETGWGNDYFVGSDAVGETKEDLTSVVPPLQVGVEDVLSQPVDSQTPMNPSIWMLTLLTLSTRRLHIKSRIMI